jgi:hypothetical protein
MRFATLSLLRIHNNDEPHNRRPIEAIAWFKNTLSLDFTSLSSWPLMDELLLVANTSSYGNRGAGGRPGLWPPTVTVIHEARSQSE